MSKRNSSPHTMRTLASITLLTVAAVPLAVAADNLKAFPPPVEGMTRHVIQLAKQRDEGAFKIELVLGKTVKTDAANRYFFAGKLEIETIPGWGFDRYILHKIGPMAGTLVASDPGAPQVERFITRSEAVAHWLTPNNEHRGAAVRDEPPNGDDDRRHQLGDSPVAEPGDRPRIPDAECLRHVDAAGSLPRRRGRRPLETLQDQQRVRW